MGGACLLRSSFLGSRQLAWVPLEGMTRLSANLSGLPDGDTFRCDGARIPLYGIDASELAGHCRRGRQCASGDPWAVTRNLAALLQSGDASCRPIDTDIYGRTLA